MLVRYFDRIVLNVHLLVIVDTCGGRVFHRRGPITPNDCSYRDLLFLVECLRRGGTFTLRPLLSFSVVWKLRSLGETLLMIFQTEMMINRSLRRWSDVMLRMRSLSW